MKFFVCKMILDKKYDYFKLKTNLSEIILKNDTEEVEPVVIKIKSVRILKDYEYLDEVEYAVTLIIEYAHEHTIEYLYQEGYLLDITDIQLSINEKPVEIKERSYLDCINKEELNEFIKEIFNSKEYGDNLLIGTNELNKEEPNYSYKKHKDYNVCILKDYLIDNDISMILCNGFLTADNILFDLIQDIKNEEGLNVITVLLLPYKNYGERLSNKSELEYRKEKADYVLYTDEFEECFISFSKFGEYHKLKLYKNRLYLLDLGIKHSLNNIKELKLN